MRSGDFVLYRPPGGSQIRGVVLREHSDIAVDTRFFDVLLVDGRTCLIPDNFLLRVKVSV